MGKKQLKGIRLESNWNTFEIEHSEVKLSKDCSGKILSFTLPDDYYLISIIFSNVNQKIFYRLTFRFFVLILSSITDSVRVGSVYQIEMENEL